MLLVIILLIPHHLHARRLYYAEEFYLYVMNLYYTNPNLERNIRFMQWALRAPFDNPVRSLARIQTEDDFIRYKALFKMHVNLLIVDSYLQLARRFDKEHVYFFNQWYAEDLQKSFTIAKYYYEISNNYWDEAIKHAGTAAEIPGRIDIGWWEDELFLIQTGKLDYHASIQDYLTKLASRQAAVTNYKQ